jgi:TonB family protein
MMPILLLLAAMMTQTEAPATPSASPSAERARWGVDGGESYCALIRTQDDGAPAFVMRIMPGSDHAVLNLSYTGPSARTLRGRRVAFIELLPGGPRFSMMPLIDNQNAIDLEGASSLLAGLARAQEMRIVQNGDARLTFAFTAAARAVGVMRECLERGGERWGVDPQRLASLRQWPRIERWVRSSDYPGPFNPGGSGTTLVRLSVDQSGRITHCAVVATSGDARYDQAACAHTDRVRGRPALDADGAPVAVDIIEPVDWVLFQVVSSPSHQ